MKALLFAVALTGCAGLVTTTPTATYEPAGTGGASANGDVVVPDLIGKTPEEAAALVEAAGFTGPVESSRPVECYDAPEVEGLVNCQSPPAGETVKRYVTVQINVYRKQRIAGAVVRDQLLALIGKTPDEAKAALSSYGHDGYVWVDMQPEYDADCGADRVCGFSVPESGMGIHDTITLYINPPPP